MGQQANNRDTGAPNLARNALVFAREVTAPALATAPFGLLDIPTTFNPFTEALELVVTCRPVANAATPAVLQILVNPAAPSVGQFGGAEVIGPGCEKSIPIPAWVNPITLAFRAVQLGDFSVQVELVFGVALYRLDRCTRDEWLGR